MENIEERINKIIKSSSINTLSGEKQIFEDLEKILQEKDNMDIEVIDKTLTCIEMYLKYKNKMKLIKEDNEFLEKLSEEMQTQRVRKSDGVIYDPIFKVTETDSEKYFLTRANAEYYQKNNSLQQCSEMIEVEENDNSDLSKIIAIIKRNF